MTNPTQDGEPVLHEEKSSCGPLAPPARYRLSRECQLLTNLSAFTPHHFPWPVAVPGPLVLQQLLGNSHGPQGQYFGVKADGKAPQPSLCWKPSGTRVAGEG